MGQSSSPFHIGAGLIIGRVGHRFGSLGYESHQQAFGQTVGDLNARGSGEVTFHDVRHHVDHAYSGLVCCQGKCELRVHNSETRLEDAIGAQA